MKYILTLFILFILSMNIVFAGNLNPYIYNSIPARSYRNNYYRQSMNPKVIPYWQAQSNYATRNRMYQNYNTYSRYMNSVNQYNYNMNMYRNRQ